jgi:hypothetical protein
MKKKQKVINIIIPLVVYPFDVMVSMGQSDEELGDILKKHGIEIDEYPSCLFENETVMARTVLFLTNQTLIRLREKPEDSTSFGHLHHEVFHAVSFILHRIGLPHTLESEEAYAYLIQYLTEQIYKSVFA